MADETTTQQPTQDIPTFDAINRILADIRPAVQMDGGDIELVEVKPEDGQVFIRMAGACVGCPASTMTLKQGIEMAIQEHYPDYEVVPVP